MRKNVERKGMKNCVGAAGGHRPGFIITVLGRAVRSPKLSRPRSLRPPRTLPPLISECLGNIETGNGKAAPGKLIPALAPFPLDESVIGPHRK